MPAKIQEVVTALKLVRKFGLVGAFTPQLDETIVPVVLTDDLTDLEEWAYAFFADDRPASGVGNRNTWSLDNPAGSGRLVQLLHVSMYNLSANDRFHAHLSNLTPELATILTPALQDLRGRFDTPVRFPTGRPRFEALGGPVLGAIVVWRGTTALATKNHAIFEPERTLIYPGERLFFQQSGTTDSVGEISLRWRERALRPDGS